MFIYFNQNKLAYHKGQLVPFFIVFIIAVIVAALVTVNVGKIAKTKTYSANAVDAGVLAAASTMASAFNYLAVANTQMIVNYQYFSAMATVSFIIGYVAMTSAIAKTTVAEGFLIAACKCVPCCAWVCPCPCMWPPCFSAAGALILAEGAAGLFNQTMQALIVQVTGYWANQLFFYKKIRENVEKYYQGALESGYSFAFNNSGLSQKLTGDQREDYREWLTNNIKDVANGSVLTYAWVDGQGRNHDVSAKVEIDPVDKYVLKQTMLPFPAETAALGAAWYSGAAALTILGTAASSACANPCAALGTTASALTLEMAGLAVSIAAHAGLAPNGNFSSTSDSDAEPYLICWLDEVPHNYEVKVYQTQNHEGTDLGVWSTEYPSISSSAQASFAGEGEIYQPKPYYDASIISTDF